jgi:hypothetical protein
VEARSWRHGRRQALLDRRPRPAHRAGGQDDQVLLRWRDRGARCPQPGRPSSVRRRRGCPPGPGADAARTGRGPSHHQEGPQSGSIACRRRGGARRGAGGADPHPAAAARGADRGGQARFNPGGAGSHAQAGRTVAGRASASDRRLPRRRLRRTGRRALIRGHQALDDPRTARRPRGRAGPGVGGAGRTVAGPGLPCQHAADGHGRGGRARERPGRPPRPGRGRPRPGERRPPRSSRR